MHTVTNNKARVYLAKLKKFSHRQEEKSMTKRNFKRMMVTLLAVMMFFTSVPSTAMAAPYPYNINGSQRELYLTDGQVTLLVDSKMYNITRRFIVIDAACDEQGTVWMEYKSGNVYWWNYDLQKDEEVIKPNQYTTGGASLNIEGDYVVSLQDLTTGEKIELLSIEEQKKVLGITSEPTEPTNPTQPEEKPTEPTPAPSQPEQKPSQPTDPSKPTQTTNPTQQPTQSEQKPSQPTTKKPSQTKKNSTDKIGKVIHKGSTYYVYSTKNKLMTKFTLTKKGIFKWRGYSMKGVLYAGIIQKSKRVVVLTKKTGYKFEFTTMKRSKLYNTKRYGKPLKFEYDKIGCVIRTVTKKPRRFSIKNK